MQSPGVGGVAATADSVFVSDREADDSVDAFFCLNAENGDERWSFRHPAAGSLDYGNSPRASPQIVGDAVVFFGAFGGLHCLDRKTGNLLWQKEVRTEFAVDDKLVWGMCSSPLVVDEKLIINPGSKEAGLAALDVKSGAVVWRSAAKGRSHGSLILAELGGKKQIVGYDADSLGGWDPATGQRLWRLAPPFPNDFNVPTPIAVDGRLFVATENNGSRVYRFENDGRIAPKPIAQHADLAPDAHSPVIVGDRVFGVCHDLYCLELKTLKPQWVAKDPAFMDYCTLVASPDRVLVVTLQGELILFDARAKAFGPLSRLRLFEDERGVYSHPAFVGSRMYIRSSTSISRLDHPGRAETP